MVEDAKNPHSIEEASACFFAELDLLLEKIPSNREGDKYANLAVSPEIVKEWKTRPILDEQIDMNRATDLVTILDYKSTSKDGSLQRRTVVQLILVATDQRGFFIRHAYELSKSGNDKFEFITYKDKIRNGSIRWLMIMIPNRNIYNPRKVDYDTLTAFTRIVSNSRPLGEDY